MSKTLHRFTPPTCTLEIKGKKSPLSRWTNQELLKKFTFQLSFDDPCLPSSKQVTLQGDRQKLEQLKTIIDHYLQNFLHSSFQSTSTLDLDSQTDSKFKQQANKNQPYLQSKGLVNHELFLGDLTHDSNTNSIQLTTVQLFDLVTALESYSTQIAALPELESTESKQVIPLWGGIAAVTVGAIAITTIALKTPSSQNVATEPQSSSSRELEQFNQVIPPQVPATPRKLNPKPKLNPSLDSAERLPPPPAVDTPKPKPDIPDPADYPLSQVARQSGLSNSAQKPKPNNQQTESVIVIPPESKVEPQQPTPDSTTAKAQTQTTIIDSDKADAPFNSTDEIDSNQTQKLPQADLVPSKPNPAVALKNSPPSQLQEIKTYFKAKWQPPAELKQSIEYRLYLNPNGSIERVVPIGKASKLYLSQTNIPVKGEPFISPLTELPQSKSVIRLLLNPNGKVKAFTE